MDPILQQQPIAKKTPSIVTTIPVVTKEEIPKITQIASNVVQIGNKKWIDKYKFDYALDTKPGGGGWIYNKAKADMGATEFGAALVLAFACEEGGWGKGNDQSNTHNMFSLLSKNPKSKVGTAHGNVITYSSWDEGFSAFKNLIDEKYSGFNDLIKKEIVTADDINKALLSGSFHKQGGYTDSDKGKALFGILKYVIVFLNYSFTESVKKLDDEIKEDEKKFTKVTLPIYLPNATLNQDQLNLKAKKGALLSLQNELKKLAVSYGKL
ncbi:glucosaminidase domain-containing protein [Flavobacterium sp. SUN052]|uniref:glucosaminidase domain-containing protein n=1 Tax=Flavobacterium sp. SUN052 TaxID=3002441 RepID=UPI00237D7D7F|nr:glucosaminidase domain-containing protein [Flavobacterium sp. SUN052]MEC4004855.1 glucosaminidase domain-containing protein [Flavobacterium sp. SUN052]